MTDRKRRRCHTGCTHHSLALGCCSCQIETQQETPRKSDERRTQPQPVLLTRCIWPKLSYASAMDVTAANCIASFPIDHQSCRAHKPRRRALHRTEGLDLRAAGPRPQPRRTAFSRFPQGCHRPCTLPSTARSPTAYSGAAATRPTAAMRRQGVAVPRRGRPTSSRRRQQ